MASRTSRPRCSPCTWLRDECAKQRRYIGWAATATTDSWLWEHGRRVVGAARERAGYCVRTELTVRRRLGALGTIVAALAVGLSACSGSSQFAWNTSWPSRAPELPPALLRALSGSGHRWRIAHAGVSHRARTLAVVRALDYCNSEQAPGCGVVADSVVRTGANTGTRRWAVSLVAPREGGQPQFNYYFVIEAFPDARVESVLRGYSPRLPDFPLQSAG